MLPLRLAALGMSLALAAAISHPVSAAEKVGEYRLKAALIRSIVSFVEHRGGGPWVVCVLGDDPFGELLDDIANQGGAVALTVRRINGVAAGAGCEAVFIARSEKPRLKPILEGLRALRTLTLGDTPGYAQAGVVLNFYLEGDKVRFEINVEAANRTGLAFSSRLLGLARIVHET
jgi:hypothetical protein